MRARPTMISLLCAAALLLAGCSEGIPGVPQMLGAGSEGAAAGSESAQPSGSPNSSSQSGSDGSDGSSGAASNSGGGIGGGIGDGGDTGLPPASNDTPSLPTAGGALPSDLGTIPGLDSGCLTVASLMLSVSVLFLGPATGQPITQADVDKAFAQAGQLPAQLQGSVKVLHDAAVQAIGKSGDAANQIVTSPTVKQAMDALSRYTDTSCGGG